MYRLCVHFLSHKVPLGNPAWSGKAAQEQQSMDTGPEQSQGPVRQPKHPCCRNTVWFGPDSEGEHHCSFKSHEASVGTLEHITFSTLQQNWAKINPIYSQRHGRKAEAIQKIKNRSHHPSPVYTTELQSCVYYNTFLLFNSCIKEISFWIRACLLSHAPSNSRSSTWCCPPSLRTTLWQDSVRQIQAAVTAPFSVRYGPKLIMWQLQWCLKNKIILSYFILNFILSWDNTAKAEAAMPLCRMPAFWLDRGTLDKISTTCNSKWAFFNTNTARSTTSNGVESFVTLLK